MRLIDADLTLTQAWQNFHKQEDEHEKLYEDYDILRDRHFEQCGFECCQQTIVNASTVLTIPDNPTNGQMLTAIYPDITFITQLIDPLGKEYIVFILNHTEIQMSLDWWNSPYKRADHE